MPNLADNEIKDFERHPLPVRFWFELSCWPFFHEDLYRAESWQAFLTHWEFSSFSVSGKNRDLWSLTHSAQLSLSWCRGQEWDLADMTSTWYWSCQKPLLALVSSYANLWDDNWMNCQELHLCVTCPSALWWMPQGMKWWSCAPWPSANWLNWGTPDPVKLNITVIRSSTRQKRCKEKYWRGGKKYV